MQFNNKISISNKIISENNPTFIIAEAGVNHCGDIELAKKLIDVAVDSGVDAVKFQTFNAHQLILEHVEKAPYQTQNLGTEQSQFDMLKNLEVNFEDNVILNDYCKEKGVIFLTTAFDEQSFQSLEPLDLPAYKISSTDVTNLPFLELIAKKEKPIILSTGMTYLEEIDLALQTLSKFNRDIILMQCTSNYPIPDNEANLNILKLFKHKYSCLIGFSDHTAGIGASPYAIPLGASVIEKHFTLDKEMDGPDHIASLNPDELKALVRTIKHVDQYMGSSIKIPTLSELETRKSLQKCLVARKEINVGDTNLEHTLES